MALSHTGLQHKPTLRRSGPPAGPMLATASAMAPATRRRTDAAPPGAGCFRIVPLPASAAPDRDPEHLAAPSPTPTAALGIPTEGFVFGHNKLGQHVGTGWHPQHGSRAFLWHPVAGLRWLDEPVRDGHSRYSAAHCINQAGEVAGVRWTGSVWRAFVWSEARGLRHLDADPLALQHCHVTGLNDAGQVVGSGLTPQGARAFVWSECGGLVLLGESDHGYSHARCINRNGQVVGDCDGRAFLWDATFGQQDLNTLVDPADPMQAGTLLLDALAIDDAGEITAVGAVRGELRVLHLLPQR